jgi:methionyl-tRNA formyltransferase
MGTPEYASIILDAIVASGKFKVSLVITQPDRPVGRKQELLPPPVKSLAIKHNINILQPNNLREVGVYETILNLKPDFIVVAAFGQILPLNILDIAPCINLHASLLPLYRGASPVQQALLNNDCFTGITAMLMEEGLDSGPILGYRYFKIPPTMLIDELMSRLSYDAALLTTETLVNYEKLSPVRQTKAASTHCKKIKKEDGLVDLENAALVYNKFKAFHGWPDIFLANGLKLLDVELVKSEGIGTKGEILKIENESVTMACTIGTIKINTLQPTSKKAMSAKAYLLGKGLKVGDNLL